MMSGKLRVLAVQRRNPVFSLLNLLVVSKVNSNTDVVTIPYDKIYSGTLFFVLSVFKSYNAKRLKEALYNL